MGNPEDTSASTQMFRAYVSQPGEPAKSSGRGVWIAIAVVLLVAAAAVIAVLLTA